MKKSGKEKQKIYSKEEIITELNHFLELQMKIAAEKEKEYYEFEKEKGDNCNGNPHQRELNNQIKAYANTAQSIVRIYSSDLEPLDEEDNKEKTNKELVD